MFNCFDLHRSCFIPADAFRKNISCFQWSDLTWAELCFKTNEFGSVLDLALWIVYGNHLSLFPCSASRVQLSDVGNFHTRSYGRPRALCFPLMDLLICEDLLLVLPFPRYRDETRIPWRFASLELILLSCLFITQCDVVKIRKIINTHTHTREREPQNLPLSLPFCFFWRSPFELRSPKSNCKWKLKDTFSELANPGGKRERKKVRLLLPPPPPPPPILPL